MKRNVKKTRWNLLIILALAVALSYGGFKYLYPQQQVDIFAIDPATSLDYGATIVTGKLQKDTAIGIEGNYFLVLADTRLILLDIQGLDSFVGQSVSISGVLSPASVNGLPMTMTVNSIKVKEL